MIFSWTGVLVSARLLVGVTVGGCAVVGAGVLGGEGVGVARVIGGVGDVHVQKRAR